MERLLNKLSFGDKDYLKQNIDKGTIKVSSAIRTEQQLKGFGFDNDEIGALDTQALFTNKEKAFEQAAAVQVKNLTGETDIPTINLLKSNFSPYTKNLEIAAYANDYNIKLKDEKNTSPVLKDVVGVMNHYGDDINLYKNFLGNAYRKGIDPSSIKTDKPLSNIRDKAIFYKLALNKTKDKKKAMVLSEVLYKYNNYKKLIDEKPTEEEINHILDNTEVKTDVDNFEFSDSNHTLNLIQNII